MQLGIDASNIRAGGGVTHLVEILKAADPLDHGFERVILWGGMSILNRVADRSWLTKVRDPMLDGILPLRVWWQRFKLERLAREAGCNGLLVPGGSYCGSFRAFVTMSRNMLPFEPYESARFGTSWPRLRYRLLHRSQSSTFLRAQGVIFLSNYARNTVKATLAGEIKNEAGIPHGVDNRFFHQPHQQRDISEYSFHNPFRILYVSIINFYKHQWNVAKAISKLRKNGLPLEIDFVGPAYPPALRRLKTIISNLDPAGEYIHYRGPVPYEQLHEIYHKADAFIFASSCENLPNILLEAMASGLPIACSNRGPMPEVLGDSGVYFDPEKPGEIADSLSKLILNLDLRSSFAQGAYDRATQYSWTRCANQTFQFLARIARESANA